MSVADTRDDIPMKNEAEDDELPDAATTTQNGVDDQKPSQTPDVKLEELFDDDDDDDDEFPASSAADSKIPSSPPAAIPPPSAQVDSLMMHVFYQRLFPFRYLFQWLNHGVKPSPDFANREFAFTLQNDAYLRYQSYPTADLLRKDVLRLNPSRFEIGPVYSTNPRDRKALRNAGAFRPVSKELVFDIDLTDYDDVRTCCSKADICSKCWAFVTMAIKVIDVALREDFGFNHVLWVYSGRRGAHAWVCDKRARNLSDDRRKAIAGYLEVVRGGALSGKRVNLKRPLHPHISRSLDILKPYFASTVLDDQDVFGDDDASDESSRPAAARTEHLLSLLPDKTLAAALRKKWSASPSRPSTSKWADIDSVARTSGSRSLDTRALLDAKQDIVLEYTYPRLDAEVSKKQIHLLKSPFVVHPGTGRVCVPIDVSRLDEFDPDDVPRVSELLEQINEWNATNNKKHNNNTARAADAEKQDNDNDDDDEGGGGSADNQRARNNVPDYEKTRLKPYIDYFRKFVAALLRDERSGKRERGDEDERRDINGMTDF
ncbi:hypothetical protein VTO42DRAFT_4357 [Malbranchea cinnamomea]